MRIFVLGYHGMLGRYIYDYLYGGEHEVIGFTRKILDASNTSETAIRTVLFHNLVREGDVLINCMGTIKPMIDKLGTLNAIQVNSIFPHVLSNVCEDLGCKLIHITSDCVFSGNDGAYTEDSPHDCLDVYGKTKSLGEPSNCTVIRTSIVGEEFGTKRSLIEWVKSENGNTVNGYLNHHWNGLSCRQVARVVDEIIKNNWYWNGVKHIYSPNSMSKYELVQTIAKVHKLDVVVNPVDAPVKCDRTLSTARYDVETFVPYTLKFNIPDIETQLKDQFENPPTVSEDENKNLEKNL